MDEHSYHLFQEYSQQFRDSVVSTRPFITELWNEAMFFEKQKENHAVFKFKKILSYCDYITSIFQYEPHSLGAITVKQIV